MANETKRPRGRPRKNSEQQPNRLKVHLYPHFSDEATGGIPRVVEGQIRHLPKFGIELVDDPEEADVIAAHATIPSTYIKRFPRKTFVAICHGLYWSEYGWSLGTLKINAEVMENILVSDAVATCSEWVANSIRRHTSRPVSVIMHGVDMEDWQGEPSKDYVLWNKTRPDPVCDPEPMNQVAALLPTTRFISTFGKEAFNIALTGSLPFADAKKLIAQAGVYLCTTRETFGIGTLEALACGVPVVGFNFGGQAEFIEHKVDGWLSPPGDIQDLARGILWALENHSAIASACRAKAAMFSWEPIAEQYAKLFRETHERKNREGPRTSIIVTNYNLHKYLPAAVDSVIAQIDPDWECIIVDDASTDPKSWPIVEEQVARDPRIRAIGNIQNVYLAEARNIGIRDAKGRYILPLDADDQLAPNAVGDLAEALDADRTISVAYGRVLFTEEDGVTLTEYGVKFQLGHSDWPFPFKHEQQLDQQNLLPYSSMYRREVWENVGGYRRRCKTAEDADLWCRLSSYGYRPEMVTKNDTLIYRNRLVSMSRKQGDVNWADWFIWSRNPELTPAGARTKEQMPVPSLDPIIVSVIIPVGPGHDRYLLDAIDSVDSQTFRNWECIVVNDTGKPFEMEFPSWVRILTAEGSTGPAHARNMGIRASRGRLFLPLDADDYLQPDAMDLMYSTHQINKDVVYSDFWEDPQGELKVYQCPEFEPNELKRKGALHTVTALTPKAYWEAVGGYDETLPAWEDWDFQLLLADKGFCSQRVPMPLFTYRKHTGFRREENVKFFQKSKDSILSKWKDLWNGKKELMACSSCGNRRPIGIRAASRVAPVQREVNSEEAVLIQYKGPKMGSTPYRGASGTVYWFAANEGPKYILRKDLEIFKRYPNDFSVVDKLPADLPVPEFEEQPVFQTPVLVAAGPPKQ